MEKDPDKSKRSPFDYLVLISKGFCMGASDVIPGVSGGTMAFILGIYEELIHAIRSFDLKSLRLLLRGQIRQGFNRMAWPFLLAVGTGILIAVFTLAQLLSWLMQNKPVLIWSFFFGLILASVISVSRRIEVWRPGVWCSCLLGTVGIFLLVGLVPVSTPDDVWFLFVCGAVAICAMILPGISGSFILVLLGKYQFVLEAVSTRDFLILLVVAGGACVGILVFSRILGWLLRRYHDVMVAVLTGLMLGSLRKVWPWKKTAETLADAEGRIIPIIQSNVLPDRWSGETLGAFCLMIAGLFVVLLLERMSRGGNSRAGA
jgi:putative membrane protein